MEMYAYHRETLIQMHRGSCRNPNPMALQRKERLWSSFPHGQCDSTQFPSQSLPREDELGGSATWLLRSTLQDGVVLHGWIQPQSKVQVISRHISRSGNPIHGVLDSVQRASVAILIFWSLQAEIYSRDQCLHIRQENTQKCLFLPAEQLVILPFQDDPSQMSEKLCPVLLQVICAVSASSLAQAPAGTFSSAQPNAARKDIKRVYFPSNVCFCVSIPLSICLFHSHWVWICEWSARSQNAHASIHTGCEPPCSWLLSNVCREINRFFRMWMKNLVQLSCFSIFTGQNFSPFPAISIWSTRRKWFGNSWLKTFCLLGVFAGNAKFKQYKTHKNFSLSNEQAICLKNRWTKKWGIPSYFIIKVSSVSRMLGLTNSMVTSLDSVVYTMFILSSPLQEVKLLMWPSSSFSIANS